MNGKVIPFNPLDKDNLGESVANALLSSPAHDLGEIPQFMGAGIYAIYYLGTFKAYERMAKVNKGDPANPTIPIYVGKAVPQGSRKGVDVSSSETSKALYGRISKHATSITEAKNLRIEDFKYRRLVVDDIWIPLGESLLISKFAPIWNTLVDGFGNHDPGSGRYKGLQPRWDVLHPGRAWAEKCKKRDESADDIIRDIRQHLVSIGL